MTVADMVRHLPSNEGIVLVVDRAVIAQLAGEAGGEEPEYREFIEKTGFDFRKDLDRIVAVIGEPASYYVASGRFDWKKISAYAGNCVKDVCAMPASQPERWISLTRLSGNTMAIAVSPVQFAVTSMEVSRTPIVEWRDTPLWIRGKGKYFSRWGLSGEEMVEAQLKGRALELKAGTVSRTIPLDKVFD